ncbi:hypothetical protein HK102_011676, partial [Quaeritorhiza haematococci]
MGDMMEAHILAALRKQTFSRFSLRFRDADVEQKYVRYFVDRTLKTWRRFAGVAILLMVVLQGVMVTQYPGDIGTGNGDNDNDSNPNRVRNDIILSLVGLVPTCLITFLSFYLKKETLASAIHWFSVAFVVFMGPVMTCGRYFITEGASHGGSGGNDGGGDIVNYYPAALTAPIYIVILVSSVFFFRIRFVQTCVALLIAASSWYLVFGLALFSPLFGGLSSPSTSPTSPDPIMTTTTTQQQRIGTAEYIFCSVAMALACVVTAFISYDTERTFRLNYLSDQRFLTINSKLHKQLSSLQKSYTNRIADLDSPLEKAIYGLKVLMASPYVSAEHLKTLDMIMGCLNSPNLLAPDLDQQVKRGQVEVDDEQEKWLFSEIARRKPGMSDSG